MIKSVHVTSTVLYIRTVEAETLKTLHQEEKSSLTNDHDVKVFEDNQEDELKTEESRSSTFSSEIEPPSVCCRSMK